MSRRRARIRRSCGPPRRRSRRSSRSRSRRAPVPRTAVVLGAVPRALDVANVRHGRRGRRRRAGEQGLPRARQDRRAGAADAPLGARRGARDAAGADRGAAEAQAAAKAAPPAEAEKIRRDADSWRLQHPAETRRRPVRAPRRRRNGAAPPRPTALGRSADWRRGAAPRAPGGPRRGNPTTLRQSHRRGQRPIPSRPRLPPSRPSASSRRHLRRAPSPRARPRPARSG